MAAGKIRVGRYLIYGLLDPRDCCLRYIGKTHKRRELRLAEHIQDALDGSSAPVHQWIRDLLTRDLAPLIFVLRRVPPEESWEDAKRLEIRRWRNWPAKSLPYVHPPQTRLSKETNVERVQLLNVREGG